MARFELVELHRRWAWRSSRFDLIFGAEAAAFEGDGFGVVEQAIEQRGGEHAVAVEDARPMFVDAVGGDQWTALDTPTTTPTDDQTY